MAMVVVLVPIAEWTASLPSAAVERLAELGVTSVSLLRDGSAAAFVLEGWAFDVQRAAEAASVVAGGCADVRTLQPLMQMAVSSTAARIVEAAQ